MISDWVTCLPAALTWSQSTECVSVVAQCYLIVRSNIIQIISEISFLHEPAVHCCPGPINLCHTLLSGIVTYV